MRGWAVRSGFLVVALASIATTLVVSPTEASPVALDNACPSPGPAAPFGDVAGDTHAAAIACLSAWGITVGIDDTTYGPHRSVTRAQMATFLARLIAALDEPLPPTDGGQFVDVSGTHANNIEALAAAGITQGTGDNRFSPGAPVSRAQMATFLTRIIEHLGIELPQGDAPFEDIVGGVHAPAINALFAAGVVQGRTATLYNPRGEVTRAQMASFLMRVADLAVANGVGRPPYVSDPADEAALQLAASHTAIAGTRNSIRTDPALDGFESIALTGPPGITATVEDGKLFFDVATSMAVGQFDLTATGVGCVEQACEREFVMALNLEVVERPSGELTVAAPNAERRSAAVPTAAGFALSDELIVLLEGEGPARSVADAIASQYNAVLIGGIESLGTYQLRFAADTDLADATAQLQSDARVAHAHVSTFGDGALDRPPGSGNEDGRLHQTWHLQQIGAPEAWEQTTGSSARVGIVDGGLTVSHEDLNVAYTNPGSKPNDHGTHVGGLACARANGIGTIGVAHGCELIGGDVEVGGGDNFWLNALAAATEVLEQRPDVVNMSLGWRPDDGPNAPGRCASHDEATLAAEDIANHLPSYRRLFDSPDARDVVFTVSGHNVCQTVPISPMAQLSPEYDNVLVVGATNSDRSLASFSGWGDMIDVAAPGGVGVGDVGDGSVGVYSTYPNTFLGLGRRFVEGPGDYEHMFGTSMAAPMVAGVVALARDANPQLRAAEVAECITNTSVHSTTQQSAYPAGYGTAPSPDSWKFIPIVNAPNAVACALDGEMPDPEEVFLETFMAAWWSQDTATLEEMAEPGALGSFESSPDGWSTYRISYSDSCQMNSAGLGECWVTLVSPLGGGYTVALHYRDTSQDGNILLWEVEAIGGGA